MGRFRGGLTTSIHALIDAEGRPGGFELTPGLTHDSQPAGDLLDGLGSGTILLADKAYDSNAIRKQVEDKGGWVNIPPKSNRKEPFAFSKWLYRCRNLGERGFNKLKQFRGISTRHDKNPENFRRRREIGRRHDLGADFMNLRPRRFRSVGQPSG